MLEFTPKEHWDEPCKMNDAQHVLWLAAGRASFNHVRPCYLLIADRSIEL
jgi:hypothetical protein